MHASSAKSAPASASPAWHISTLPEEIFIHIFERLDRRSMVDLLNTSKELDALCRPTFRRLGLEGRIGAIRLSGWTRRPSDEFAYVLGHIEHQKWDLLGGAAVHDMLVQLATKLNCLEREQRNPFIRRLLNQLPRVPPDIRAPFIRALCDATASNEMEDQKTIVLSLDRACTELSPDDESFVRWTWRARTLQTQPLGLARPMWEMLIKEIVQSDKACTPQALSEALSQLGTHVWDPDLLLRLLALLEALPQMRPIAVLTLCEVAFQHGRVRIKSNSPQPQWRLLNIATRESTLLCLEKAGSGLNEAQEIKFQACMCGSLVKGLATPGMAELFLRLTMRCMTMSGQAQASSAAQLLLLFHSWSGAVNQVAKIAGGIATLEILLCCFAECARPAEAVGPIIAAFEMTVHLPQDARLRQMQRIWHLGAQCEPQSLPKLFHALVYIQVREPDATRWQFFSQLVDWSQTLEASLPEHFVMLLLAYVAKRVPDSERIQPFAQLALALGGCERPPFWLASINSAFNSVERGPASALRLCRNLLESVRFLTTQSEHAYNEELTWNAGMPLLVAVAKCLLQFDAVNRSSLFEELLRQANLAPSALLEPLLLALAQSARQMDAGQSQKRVLELFLVLAYPRQLHLFGRVIHEAFHKTELPLASKQDLLKQVLSLTAIGKKISADMMCAIAGELRHAYSEELSNALLAWAEKLKSRDKASLLGVMIDALAWFADEEKRAQDSGKQQLSVQSRSALERQCALLLKHLNKLKPELQPVLLLKLASQLVHCEDGKVPRRLLALAAQHSKDLVAQVRAAFK